MPALVVSIDGPDFSGKSTIANLLMEILRKSNNDIIFKRTEVPSTLSTGFFTKILRNSADEISSNVFALAYATDHLHHYETVIEPLNGSGKNYVVIQERSLLSTYIYQSLIGKTDLKWLKEINKFDKNIPNLTILLKVPANEIIKRSQLEKRDHDKFETPEHLEEELKVYYNLPEELANEFNVEYIDAGDNPENVAERCAKRIQKEIDERLKWH
ncbi:MAG: dTMP kinase [Candidatus Aenigmarchaeota archaeon]|nr:dTMP kinase [Candidatus Aenigmarchaeota archaeon]